MRCTSSCVRILRTWVVEFSINKLSFAFTEAIEFTTITSTGRMGRSHRDQATLVQSSVWGIG